MDKNKSRDDHLHISIFGILDAKASGRLAIFVLFLIVLLLVPWPGLHLLSG